MLEDLLISDSALFAWIVRFYNARTDNLAKGNFGVISV